MIKLKTSHGFVVIGREVLQLLGPTHTQEMGRGIPQSEGWWYEQKKEEVGC